LYFHKLEQQVSFILSLIILAKNILKIIIYPQYLKEDNDDKKPLLSPSQSTESIALSV
jgi:hypothetical protein